MMPKEEYGEFFGAGIDYTGAVIRGIVMFCIVLAAAFLGYQEGDGPFRPLLYAAALPGMSLLCTWAFRDSEESKRTLRMAAGILLLPVWFAITVFVKECPRVFAMMGVLAVGFGLYTQRFCRGEKGHALMRFRLKKHYMKYGTAVFVCAIVVIVESADASAEYPISAEACTRLIVAAFIAYLVCGIALRYFYEEYQHFRNKTAVQRKTILTTRRMNKSVLVIISMCFAGLLLLMRETLIRGFGMLLRFVIGGLVKMGFMGLEAADLSWLYKLFGAGDGAYVTDSVQDGEFIRVSADGDSLNYILMGIGVVVFVVVFILVLRNYKRNGAAYVVEEEEAAYIDNSVSSLAGKRKRRLRKKSFDSDYAGRVRKLFYEKVDRSITAEQAKSAGTRTAQEIVREYLPDEELADLTRCYEKARYGRNCTREDVQRARSSAAGK